MTDMTDTSVRGSTAFTQLLEQHMRLYTGFDASRKIPRLADGMKTSGSRVLFGMEEMGARPDKGKVKSARITGEIMGKYHPHGTDSIYGVIVNMVQESSQRYPFIEGQGGWGSVERGASADRYTKCRMNLYAKAMLGGFKDTKHSDLEIYQNAVPRVPSYSDDAADQPLMLPALFPNFVVNGGRGPATGIATMTPSHNLSEVMDLALYMVDHKKITVEKVRESITGPDMAADCLIYDEFSGGKSQIDNYIETGRGSFRMVARHRIEKKGGTKKKPESQIIIYGLPYGSQPTMVVAGINYLAATGVIPGDITATNLSSGENGMRIVVNCRRHDPESVWATLLIHGGTPRGIDEEGKGRSSGVVRTTSLNVKFSVNMAGIHTRPQKVNLILAMKVWLEHRKSCIRRKMKFRLEKIDKQIAVLEAQIAAAPIAREIVDLLMETPSNRQDQIKAICGKFPLSEFQAEVILDMTISRIVSLDIAKLSQDKKALEPTQKECREVLENESKLNNTLRADIRQVKKELGDDRRSIMMEGSFEVEEPSLPLVTEDLVKGYLMWNQDRSAVRWVTKKTANLSMVSQYGRFTDVVPVDSSMSLEGITTDGLHLRGPKVDTVPDKAITSAALFAQVINGSQLQEVWNCDLAAHKSDVLIVTKSGKAKRTNGDTMSKHRRNKGSAIITLDEGDSIIFSALIDKDDNRKVVVMTKKGYAMKRDLSSIAAKGDKAKANGFMKIAAGDEIIGAYLVSDGDIITYWLNRETVGAFPVSELEQGNLNTLGKKYTQSRHDVAGAVVGTELSWIKNVNSDPEKFAVTVTPSIALGDRNIARSVAEGISQSQAVWVE